MGKQKRKGTVREAVMATLRREFGDKVILEQNKRGILVTNPENGLVLQVDCLEEADHAGTHRN
jgi:hypothetical protein